MVLKFDVSHRLYIVHSNLAVLSWKLDYSPIYFTSNSYNASGIYAMIILQTSILFRINEQQVKALSKKEFQCIFIS